MKQLKIVTRKLTDADRESISCWHYGGDLGVYDPRSGAVELRDPDHVALALHDGVLLGYGTLGLEAQVPGGTYAGGQDVLDLGIGLRPDLVGQGHGSDVLRALMKEAQRRFTASRYRVTVASANPRATALVMRLGFTPSHRFQRKRDGREFVQYERPVMSPDGRDDA